MATTGQDGGGTVYIRPVVSADGVAAGVADIKQEFASIPVAADQAAKSTNKSLASLGVPADATANIERFKDAFGGIARATKEELGESARFTNSYVSQLRRTAADVDSVTQAMVNKARTLQSADPRLQNDTVNQTIAGLQKLATQNAITAEATLKQASAQQVANKAASEAAIQFGNFERSAAAARLELLSFGKTASEKYQIRAELLGIDKTQAVQKIVADLKAAEAAALAAGKGVGAGLQQPLERLGMTAKQTTAALRQVPAQFTDIIVSLQGGQAPLTVLLQQGGQLKDVFGGVGAAAKALGGYALGLVNPFTMTAAAVGAVATAYYLGSKESDEFRKSLALSGNQVGLTVGGLADMANNMGAVSGTTGAAAGALATFAASGAVGAAGIQKATDAALALEKYGGQAVEETAKQFKALGDDPLKASIKLNDSVNFLTTSLYEQIRALEEQGRTVEAAALAQDAFANASKSNAGEIQANLGLIERGWIGIKSAILEAVDAAKGIGRPETIGAQIAEKQALISQYQKNGYDTTKEQAELEALNRRALREQDIATSKAQQKLETENLVAANKILDSFASKQVKMEKEILASRTALVRAGIDNKIVEETIGKIREKYKEKAAPKETITDAQRSLASYLSDVQKRIDKEEELTEVQKAQNLLASLGTLGQIAQVRELVLGRATLVDTQLAETAAAKESAKALEEKSKALDKWYDLRVKDSADLDSQISKRQKEVDAIGETAEAIGELTAAKYDEAAANKESYAAALQNASAYAGEFKDAYLNAAQDARDQAAKLRELSRLSTLEGTKKASVEAAKEAAKAWQKGWEETDRLAREVFVTWAEDGSNAAKKIGDTLKKALLSAIYEATIKPVAFQIYSSATNALGLPGAGGSSGSGLFDTASNAYGLYNKASSFFGGGASSAFGFAGMAGAGTAAGATAVLPAVTTAAIEAGITAGGASIYSIGAAAGAAGVTTAAAGGGTLAASGVLASGAATTAAAGTGAAAAGAAAIPGIGWAIGGALLLAGLLGGGGRYVQSTGETSLNFDESGKETYRAPYRFRGMDEATAKEYGMKYVDLNEGANNFATSLNKTYLSAAKSLGITAAASNFAYGGNDADSSTGQGKFRLGAGVVGGKSYFDSGEIAKSDEALKLAASRAVLTALSGSEMPKYLAGVFDSVGDIATNSQAQIDAVLATAQSFKALHDSLDQLPFDNLKDQTYDVYKALTDAAGGLEQFGQKLSGYYDNFYSAEEKRTQTLNGISKRLADGGINVGVDALEKMSRADFRALFETIQTTFTGQASTGMVAALLDVQGAFASVTAATDAAMKSFVADGDKLQADLLAALGDSVGAQAAQRAIAIAGLGDAAVAQYDYNQSLRDQISAANAAAAAAQNFVSALGSVAATRQSLEAQLLGAQGDTAGALALTRKNELASLTQGLGADDAAKITAAQQYNYALEDQITALQNAKTAAEASARASDQLRQAWQSVTDSIFGEVKRIRGLMGGNSAQSFAGAQAAFSITAAQASAGDQNAAKLLPGLSQALLTLAEAQATSLLQLRAIQGQTAGTLEKLGGQYAGQYGLTIPKLATGTNYVPQDMLAMLHQGEAVVPAAYNPGNGGGGTDALIAEVQALRLEISDLKALQGAGNDSAKITADTLRRVTRGGEAMQVSSDNASGVEILAL